MSEIAVGEPDGSSDDGSSGGEERLKRLGDRLLARGVTTSDELDVALREQQRSGKMLGAILVEFGFINEGELAEVLAESAGLAEFDAENTLVDPEVIKLVPKDAALSLRALPYSMMDGLVLTAMADPYDVVALDRLRGYFPIGHTIEPRVCPIADLNDAIDRAYGYEMSFDGILKELETGQMNAADLSLDDGQGYTHPLVRLIDAILLDAVKMGASDIHLEPEAPTLRLRYRIDGVLSQIRTFHKEHWAAMLQRLKIISGMNIAEKLKPQDGRVNFKVGGHDIDFRVSVWPTVDGENVVMRVLDKDRALLPLPELGFNDEILATLNKIVKRPEGITIVTGPTGSGKTTTLYAMLSRISSIDINIMTVEDPVEYRLPLIRQAQIRAGTGVTYEDSEKFLLRQDPDVWFIGEIRDTVTAEIALRAAMTGHQVYTTLHTNDAIGALPRLLDLGLKPELMAGNIVAVIAQRLTPKLCPECKEGRPANPAECRLLGLDGGEPPVIYHPVGCAVCNDRGFKGRYALAEILVMDDEIDELIASGGTRNSLKILMRKKGFKSLVDDGVEKVLAGDISLEHLTKVVDLTDRM